VLGPGDSIAFDSTTPHRLINIGDEPVHAIWLGIGRRTFDRAGPVHPPRSSDGGGDP